MTFIRIDEAAGIPFLIYRQRRSPRAGVSMLLAAVVKQRKVIERGTINASVLAIDHHYEEVDRRGRAGRGVAKRIERYAAEDRAADFDPQCRRAECGVCLTSGVLPSISEYP